MFTTSGRPLGLAFVCAALAAVAACAPAPDAGGPPLPASGLHRVQASGDAAEALVASGARVVEDYGAFRILDAAPATLQAAAARAGDGVEYRDEFLQIRLSARRIDTAVPGPAALRAPHAPSGKGLHLVQFAGPVRAAWLERLRATGVRVVSYVPANAYLVYGDAPALERAHAHAASAREVQLDTPYLPEDKLAPEVESPDVQAYAVQLVEDEAVNAATIALARAAESRPARVSRALGYVNVVLHASRAALDELARRPDVVSIQPWVEPRPRDERQDMIVAGQLAGTGPTGPGYLDWLGSRGFTQEQFDTSGFGVDVTDSGIDNGTLQPNHYALYRKGEVLGASRVAYVRLQGTPNGGSTIQGCDGHGTVNAHIIGGYTTLAGAPHADAQGFRYGLGVAPFVRVGGSVIFDPDYFTFPDYEDLQSRAFADGMRVSSNSWGSDSPSYGSDAQRYDALVRDAAPDGSAAPQPGNQQMVIVFAAGNAGPYGGSVGTPGNAKNVLTAGASENVQAFGSPDQCGLGDSSADAALDMVFFSSRGPSSDGRIRPDIVAPGTHVSGGVAQAPGQRANPPANPLGQANACYAATGVCGGPAGGFFPTGQQWYTASSGTSHSTPAVAGAAALLRQKFLNDGLPAPSPAMTKAWLMNAARYMTGEGANDSLYSNTQGMGLLDLGTAFDETPRMLRDQEAEDLFTASGQSRTFASAIGDPTRPFRVTLAWTDAPGATFGSAWQNDLDLTVEVDGVVYRGNVFAGATSVAGGSADFRNNAESVFLPAGTSGAFTVTVTAANVVADGVPGNASPLDQDFALVVTNGCAATPPPAPTGVSAAATADNQITVSWTGQAAQYHVYRSTASGTGYARVATVSAPPFVDTGRSGGVTYHYVVRAQQDCAVSALSAEAAATATGACLLEPGFAGLASAAATGADVCGIALAWAPATPACGGTIAYDVYRSTSSGFVPGPATRIASGVGGTGYVDGGVVGGTVYRYVVRAVESSAASSVSDANTIERGAAAGRRVVAFRDDFDSNRPPDASARWIERVIYGSDALSLVSGCRWQSPSGAYRFGAGNAICGGSYQNGVRNDLVLGGDGSSGPNGFALPAGSAATLTFRIAHSFESYYDGARLAFSTSGAAGPFTPIDDVTSATAPYIASGRYDGQASALGGDAWTGSNQPANGSLREVVVNLDALAGHTVWIAWQFGTDGSVTYEGLHLDDVVLELNDPSCITCTTPAPPVPAGVSAWAAADNQITVSWTPNGASSYEVRRSSTAQGPWTVAGTAAAPPFVDQARSGGSTYHYVVRALQGCAASADSAVASATATGACMLPPAFAGLATAESSGGLTCGNVLAWTPATPGCGGSLAYDVYRSTSGGFVPGPASRIATGLSATSHVDSGDLVSGTRYHYVVRAVETTAAGSVSDENVVERSAVPTWSGGSFSDDFDAGRPALAEAYWVEQTLSGADHLGLVAGCRWQSPTTAYRFGAQGTACGGAYGAPVSNRLVLGGDGSVDPLVNGFDLVDAGARLSFRLWYSLEYYYDGAYLVYSTVSAAGPFSAVPDAPATGAPYITAGGYDGTIVGGVRAWTGTAAGGNGSLKQVEVNLDALAGQRVWFGWAFSADPIISYEGLYLDDVAVQGAGGACSTTPIPPGPAVRFRIDGIPATVGVDVPAAFTVTALDQYGQVAVGHAGTARFTSSDGAAILPGPVTFAAGVATGSVRFRTMGRQTLAVADDANPAIVGTAGTQVTAGPAAALRFLAQPGAIVAGSPFSPPVAVEIVDGFGNRTGSAATVTLALGANPGSGVILGTASAVASAGAATFPSLSVDRAADGYTLTASSAGLAGAESATFRVSPSSPAALAFTSFPATAVAGEPASPPIEVDVLDAYGNRTDASLLVTLSLAASPPGGTLSGTLSAPSAAGRASFPDVRLTRAGAGYVLLASTGALSTTSGGLEVVAAAPYRVVFTVQPRDVAAGLAFEPAPAVALLDRFDNLAATATNDVTLALGVNPAGAALTGTTTVAASGGTASFPGVAVTGPGLGYALWAGASGLHGEASVGFDVASGTAARYAISGPEEAIAGVPATYTVTARDAGGWLVPSYAGIATVSSSDAQAELPAAVQFAGGSATVRAVFRTQAVQTLTLADASAPALGGSTAVAVLPPPPPGTAVRFRVDGLPANLDADAPATVTVVALDADDAPATSHAGTLAFSSTDPAAVLPAPVAFASGVATATVRLRTAGPQTLLAVNPANPAVRGSATTRVGAGPAAALRFLVHPTSVEAGAAFVPPPAVEVLDAFGNRSSSGAQVTLALASGPGGAAVLGYPSVAAVAGVATFPNVAVDRAAAGYALVASAAGLAPATSAPFDVRAGLGHRLVFVDEPSDAVAGEPIAPAVTVDVLDSWGNRTDSSALVTVALATGPDGATVSGTPVAVAVAGRATFSDLRLEREGGYVLYAESSGVYGDASVAFAVRHGPAVAYSLTGPAEVTAGVEAVYALRVRDGCGNGVPEYAATASVTSSDRQAVLPSAVSLGGEASVAIVFRTAGTQTVTVTDVAAPEISGSMTVAVVPAESGGGGGGGGGCGTAGGGGMAGLALAALAVARRRRAAAARP